MITFNQEGFLTTAPVVPEAKEVLRFPSATGGPDILWNVDAAGYHVLKLPSIKEIESIVATETAAILKIQWTEYILKRPEHSLVVERGVRMEWFRGFVSPTEVLEQASSERRRELLEAHSPTTLSEANERLEYLWLASRGNVSAIAPSANGITKPAEWLGHFYGLFWPRLGNKTRAEQGIAGRLPPSAFKGRWGLATAVAAELRTRGYIVAPQNTLFHVSRNAATRFPEGQNTLRPYLLAKNPSMVARMLSDFEGPSATTSLSEAQLAKVKVRALDLGYCTTLESTDEISWPFAERFRTPSDHCPNPYVRHVTAWLRSAAKRSGAATKVEIEKSDPFMGVMERFRLSIPKWYALVSDFRKTIVVKKARSKAATLLPLLRWAEPRLDLVDPVHVRREHIRNDISSSQLTFHEVLSQSAGASKTKNACLNVAHDLFEHLVTISPKFRNPVVPRIDSFRRQLGERSSVGKTYRKRIPSYVLEDLKQFLVVSTEAGFAWGKWVQDHERVIIDGASVFCPLRPAILALLASWPLRINQVSWLDSGELDDNTYDRAAGLFVPNPAGIPGRQMGVLQPASDDEKIGAEHRIDLLIAINKRPIGDRAEYTIPFVDGRTMWIVGQVAEWQKRYGLAGKLVREADAPYDFAIAQDETARGLMPEICPLFRDPQHRGLFPPSYGRMKSFWVATCAAYDDRNANWTNPQTGLVEQRKGWPALSKTYEKDSVVSCRAARSRRVIREQKETKRRYRYDLYSLKVGGVSYLLDRGIPLAIVAAMAGHKSLTMTLRYFVLDRAEFREKLSTLAKRSPSLSMRPTAIEAKLQEATDYSEWLLGSQRALTALQHAVREGKNFTISTTGICPGARCEEGLKLKLVKSDGNNRSGAVPGALCGLCEFRVYGPPFLIGLAKEFNESIYTLAELAKRQKELRERQRILESDGQFDEAIVCRNEDEELSRRSEADCAHTARLFEMINECLRITEEETTLGSGASIALVAQKPLPRPSIEAVGTFEQWKEILELAELVPSAKSLIPEQVGIRFQNKLMGLLARNGAAPFLAVLPDRIARRASLEFAALLERAVPSSSDREDVFEGRVHLRDLGLDVERSVLDAAKHLAENCELPALNCLSRAKKKMECDRTDSLGIATSS